LTKERFLDILSLIKLFFMLSALISVFVVSLISLIGIFSLAIKEDKLREILFFLVSFSTGTLLASAIFHLIPEAVEEMGFGKKLSFCLIGGILTFFILEKFIRWRHCHILTSKDHPHPIGYMNLIGDAFHNFLDGMMIAAAYLVNNSLGLITTLAVISHEIPQEIGDFGILLHAGFSKKRALLFNFASALFAVFGCLITFLMNNFMVGFSWLLVPFTAGGFIYLTGSDLIPELHRETNIKKSFFQLLGIILGICLMFILKFLE